MGSLSSKQAPRQGRYGPSRRGPRLVLQLPCGTRHEEIAMARRYPEPEHPTSVPSDASSRPWETRIQILIAVALGLAAIVTASAVYRNEQEDHKADKDFHAATGYL